MHRVICPRRAYCRRNRRNQFVREWHSRSSRSQNRHLLCTPMAPEPEDEPMVVVPSVSAPEVKGKPQILQPLDAGVRVIGECFQTYIIAETRTA